MSPSISPDRGRVKTDTMTRSKVPATEQKQTRILQHLLAGLVLAALVTALFAQGLFGSDTILLSHPNGDLLSQYVYLRTFCFDQLRQGNIALWNPYIFCGTPCLQHFETAMLYPLNTLFLFLPLARAINISMALHVFLIGYFMYLWAHSRGLYSPAAIACGIIVMFCGAHYCHVYAGHLSNLCTMTWVPLLFLAIDGIIDHRSIGWVFLGMGVTAMMVLAGHPQYVYYTAIAAALYCMLNLTHSQHRKTALVGLIALCLGGLALSSIQLLPGLTATGESVRAGGTTFSFASRFSFPPENLLTLAAPFVFGGIGDLPYWGRCYSWEMLLFIGITGITLALLAGIHVDRLKRRFAVCMIIVLLILAFGCHTPLFQFLYNWLPGFNKFRGSSKFSFQASLFLALLAGAGLDYLFRGGLASRRVAVGLIVVSVLFAGAALWVHHATFNDQGRAWEKAIKTICATHEATLFDGFYSDRTAVLATGKCASISLFVAAGTFALLGILLAVIRSGQRLAWTLVILAVVECVIFARLFSATCDLSEARIPGINKILAKCNEQDRTLNLISPNDAMIAKVGDIWGYSPGVSKRYAEFMTYTQNNDMNDVNQDVNFSHAHPLYRMLRLRYIFAQYKDRIGVEEAASPLPQLQLISDYRVAFQRDQIFAIMDSPHFDPAKQVVLEKQPDPEPVPSGLPGSARIVNSSTDHLTIEADVPQPVILLVTDGYSKGWCITSLPGSVQKEYEIMPANYVLRAVPLTAGHHIFRMEYYSAGFVFGKWISLLSLIVYVVAVLLWVRGRLRLRPVLVKA